MGNVIMSGIVPQLVAPVTGIALADMAVGSIVKLNESGSPVEFYVAKHDYESGLNGSGRTLLVRKDAHSLGQWGSISTYDTIYANNTLDNWMNATYKSLFDMNVQSLIGNTTFYYTPNGYTSSGNSNITTLTRSVFALSGHELGFTSSYANEEGSPLPIASQLISCLRNNKAVVQWTRTPRTQKIAGAVFRVNTAGRFASVALDGSTGGYRPCFTLPATTLFDEETLLLKGVS